MNLITLASTLGLSVLLAVGVTRTILWLMFLFIPRGAALSSTIPREAGVYEAHTVDSLAARAA